MPNWTSCKLDAPPEVLKKYINKDDDGKLFFDFNLVIPMPEIYKDPELTEGFDTDWCIYWYLTDKGNYHINPSIKLDLTNAPKMLQRCRENSEEYLRRGEKYVKARNAYGYKTWYEWSNVNWGTKWNAVDSAFDDENEPKRVSFDTAWCYPAPIVKKIMNDNPDCVIEFTWEDEDYDGTYTMIRRADGTFDMIKTFIER